MSAHDDIPSDAPPSYATATGGSSSRPKPNNTNLSVPGSSSSINGLTAAQRRSMEDEHRPLPKGWVRSFDTDNHHQFFVDTTKDPPRSIWHHPYDDEEYLATLSSEERERIEQESLHRGNEPTKEDIMMAHSDDDDDEHMESGELPPRTAGKGKGKGSDGRSFGRKFKDKVTGTTHEQRVQERKKRAEQERKAYEQQQRIRSAMAEANRTGAPVLLGKDKDGKDVYVEPAPADPYYGGGYGGGYGGYGYGGYGYGGGYGGGYGTYTSGNNRYIRPSAPYGRPVGYGYGGGYGLPIGLGLGGGLLGGLLLGDLLF